MSVSTADRNFPGPENGWISAFGRGEPVTLFSHGFSGQIRDTRPFAAGVHGTRALVNLGGHGGRPSPGPGWDYGTIASQLGDALTAAEVFAGAPVTRALGVSMSAGGLARLLTSHDPQAVRLEKAVFVLPASWAGFSQQLSAQIDASVGSVRKLLEAGDREGLLDYFLSREPAEVQALEPARSWAGQKVDALLTTDMSEGVGLAAQTAVADPATAARAAADFKGEVLVLTHEGDPSHPVEIARDYAAAFPSAQLEILPPGSILWRGRAEVRRILTDFLND